MTNSNGIGNRLVAGITGTIGIKLTNILLGLSSTILLGRILGPDGYGLYSLAYIVVILVGVPINSGLRSLLIREVARLQYEKNWSILHGLLIRAYQAVGAFSVIAISIGGVFLWGYSSSFSSQAIATYSGALFLFPLIGYAVNFSAVLSGLRYVVLAQIPDLVIRPLLFLLLVLFIHVLGTSGMLNPESTMIVHIIAAFTGFFLAGYLLIQRIPIEIREACPVFQTRIWLASIAPFTFTAGIGILHSNIDIIMLGLLRNYESVGIYRVVTQGALLVAFTLQAVNLAIGPYISRLYAENDLIKLQKLLRLSSLIMFGLALPIVIVLVVFGETILGIVFGDSFKVGATALAILCVGQFVNVAMGSVALILNMTGHEKETLLGTIIAALFNAILNLPMILYFGIEGAALATSCSLILWNIFLSWRLYVRTGLKSYIYRERSNYG